MRVIWKDSNAKTHKPMKYRKHMMYGSTAGWSVDIEGDNNLYKTHYDAKNAIDKHLGGTAQKRGCAKRKDYGITIVGKVEKNKGETA